MLSAAFFFGFAEFFGAIRGPSSTGTPFQEIPGSLPELADPLLSNESQALINHDLHRHVQLNNLFSRFNFKAQEDALPDEEQDVTVTYEFDDEGEYWFRTFRGRLIQPMPEEQRTTLAERIKRLDIDVLAVQEVEDIEALRDFAYFYLGGLYRHAVLIEGNDPRFIDVGVLSKKNFPIGAVTSWQHTLHPSEPGKRVFSRDLLQVEILNQSRSKRLLTLFNTHLKSHYVPPDQDPVSESREANEQRMRQAEIAAEIIEAQTRPDSRYVVVGDMNDPPESE